MKNKKLFLIFLVLDIIAAIGLLVFLLLPNQNADQILFNGERSLATVKDLVNMGPRVPDSLAHASSISYFQAELIKCGWQALVLEQKINGHVAYNILATRSNDIPVILIGAHYDSRILAARDIEVANRNTAVPGAKDGASGKAFLLELARSLPKNSVSVAL